MTYADIAFAAGFSSVRQFNDTIREVYASSPTDLRGRRGGPRSATGTVTMRLAVRTPFAGRALLDFLAYHLITGVETAGDGWYARTLDLPHGPGTVRLDLANAPTPGETAFVAATFELTDLRDTTAAVERARRLVDADCDPLAVDDHFAEDPVIGPLVRRTPGLRVPGQVDGDETAIRTVIGQQVSVAGACTVTSRLVAEHGRPVATSIPGSPISSRPLRCWPAVARGTPDAALAWPGAGRSRFRARVRGRGARPRARPGRRTPAAAGAARDRALDGGLRRDAGAGPSRRVPADRHRRAQRARRAGSRPGRGGGGQRGLAAVAVLRPDAPVEHPDATLDACGHEGELTCGP